MIYLDSAATSLQKPADVRYAASNAIAVLSSPGRGGYEYAMEAANVLLDCREELAGFLGVSEPERVIFTSSATHGLNIAIKSLIEPGDKVVVSGYEHNAVMRPLQAVGADVVIASSPLFEPEKAVTSFSQCVFGAKAAVCCHVSNVFGYILPIEEIADVCWRAGVPLIVDMSQSAGSLAINFDELHCAFGAMPGHKGLLGPQGTGVLLCGQAKPAPLLHGGTGSESERLDMPEYLPDRLEAGTHNMPGIAGLLAGVRWIRRKTANAILEHEQRLLCQFCEELSSLPGLRLYNSKDPNHQSGVLSLQATGIDCEDLAYRLGCDGIAVRAGLHCAPLAHQTVGTFERGTVRFSFSPFNTMEEIRSASTSLRRLVKA